MPLDAHKADGLQVLALSKPTPVSSAGIALIV
jgi:hypothetical protein